jgi:hydrogenase-4 component B
VDVTLLLCALGLLLVGGTCALVTGRSTGRPAGRSTRWGVGSVLASCALGAVPALRVVLGGPVASLHRPWDVPYGSFSVEIDALSAFFLLVVFGVSGVAAIYGGQYLQQSHGAGDAQQAGAPADGGLRAVHPGESRSDEPARIEHVRTPRALGPAWFFYGVLVASMGMVVVARNAILFLMAWELMTLASFLLVTFEDDDESVRAAGRTYLIAMHLGTAFLLVAFALLGRQTGSLDFERFAGAGKLAPSLAGVVFLLGVVGFGTKAGFVPFHVWLPEAHPAAPTHVSAVMSGAMIKMGVYGLLRLLTFLGPPAPWWGAVLIGIGLLSGVLGALFALAQHDLKRLLAYSSVENMGIVAMGVGIGLLGLAAGAPIVAVLGFAGALLHVANHALFKGLLFLGAGAVALRAGTRTIDRLGGLLGRMPTTGTAFLVGAAAICGLPPLNGFASEFLVYLAALRGGTTLGVAASLPALGAAAGLAVIGGLAVAAFAKAFGIAFLGTPRSAGAAGASEVGGSMRLAMKLLASGCVAAGLAAPWLVAALAPVLAIATQLPTATVAYGLSAATRPLRMVVLVTGLLLALVAVLEAVRRALLRGRTVERSVTWDCGYALPTPRKQYTGSSFVQPLTGLFGAVLRVRREVTRPAGLFPSAAAFASQTPDAIDERLYRPAFGGAARGLAKLRWLQHGHLNLYMLYIALTLLVLLVWKLG